MELFIMNIYDTKLIHCSICKRFIGEIDYDAIVMLPKCGKCTNQLLEENDSTHMAKVYDEILAIMHKPVLCNTLHVLPQHNQT